MKTDRRRYDRNTRRLLWFEKCIERALTSRDSSKIKRVLDALRRKIDALTAIRTSKELDYLLQLTMIFITARLASQSSTPDGEPYKATIAVHYPQHKAISVKPSFYSPGRCFVQHTTISLAPGQPGEQIGLAGRIGHSGLSLLHGQVLYCPLQGSEERSCCQYVSLKRGDHLRTRTALCIPLRLEVRKVIAAFSESNVGCDGERVFCRVGAASCDCSHEKVNELVEIKGTQNIESLAVLNLECATDDLSLARARAILDDNVISSLIEKITRDIEGYSRGRGKYKVIRTCTSLFDLSQHNLSIRETYRALMQEVSQMCDEADVTLHLRDLRTPEDKGRCINLVTGVGRNFRGFLVNERHGLEEGLVGSVLSKHASDYATKPQIDEALTAEYPSKPFKQLMPRSCLNLAVPLAFHNLLFGVLNIEWDEQCLATVDVERFAKERLALIERLGAYFSQVVDFYEDRENPSLHPRDEQVLHAKREVVQRQMMDYHVQGAIKDLETLGSACKEMADTQYLKKLIDAVGYLVGFDSDLRVMVSLRKLVVEEGQELLRFIEHLHHGVPRVEGTRRDLPVELGTSVLGTCAKLGVPLFGEVIERRAFKPDTLCLRLLRAEELEELRPLLDKGEICYATCGQPEPRYEVALPLLFGGRVLGTLDFELFATDEKGGRGNGARTVPHLKRHELSGFLDWARAIAFCMALYEDRKMWHGLDKESQQSLSRFQTLCAQVIANIRLPAKQAEGIAREYFRELIPFADLSADYFDEARENVSDSLRDGFDPKLVSRTPLKFRGRHLGELVLDRGLDSDPPRRCIFPEHRGEGPGGMVRRLMAAYFTSNHLTVQHEAEGSLELVESLQRIRDRIEEAEKEKVFSDPAHPAGKVVEELFRSLGRALAEEFNSLEKEVFLREPGRYAWFLFLASLDVKTGVSSFRCGEIWDRWGGADTEDMKARIEEVRRQVDQDRGSCLRAILVRAHSQKDVDVMVERAARGGYSQASLRSVFTEILADKEYPAPGIAWPDQSAEEISFTLHVAASRKVQVSIDFNMSPHRSPRDTRWFYAHPYSIVGIPIVLGGRAIGVLNILRQRSNRDDFLFFSNEELDAVNNFQDFISSLLRKHVDCKELPCVIVERRLPDLRSRQLLADQLRQALKNGRKIITVECKFADHTEEIRQLFSRVDTNAHVFDQADWNWKLFLRRLPNRGGIIVLSFSDILSEEPRKVLREAANSSRKLVVFFRPEEASELISSIPEGGQQALDLSETREELEEHFLVRLSEYWGLKTNDNRDRVALFRTGGAGEGEKTWTIADAMAGLGGSASQIDRGVSRFLNGQLAADVSTWRGFSDWMVYHVKPSDVPPVVENSPPLQDSSQGANPASPTPVSRYGSAEGPQVSSAGLRVFISYSHNDRALKDSFLKHLGAVAKVEGISLWSDQNLKPGTLWRNEIESQLENCDVAVLLLSPSFLDSQFCQDVEIPALLRRHEQQGVRIVPINLKANGWAHHSTLRQFVVFPRDGKAIAKSSVARRDEIFVEIVNELVRMKNA